MAETAIFTDAEGHVSFELTLSNDTIWLSQELMAILFGTKRQAISKHLKNIFSSGELDEKSVCSKMEHTAPDGKKYKIKFYSLDAIISVGYRVNSTLATKFRIWATEVLKEHLIKGYTIYKKRLAEQGMTELQQSVELLQKTLKHHSMINDIGDEAIQLILSYAKTWSLLLSYDENRLALPKKGAKTLSSLNYKEVAKAIACLKTDLSARKEATTFFGKESGHSFKSILKNIDQTFDGKPLYKSAEEKAAHLLYFIIKDHPFTDGNKRIGCFVFLLYLKLQSIPIKINENGLVALALLVAESNPSQKELMIRLTVNILID